MTGVIIWKQSNNTAVKMFSQFLSHLFMSRKKSFKSFSKSYKQTKQHSHQGRRECERRRRQLHQRRISNHPCSILWEH